MKFNEFETQALKNLQERRGIDESLPALAAIAKAKQSAKPKANNTSPKTAIRKPGQPPADAVADQEKPQANNPNATVGSQDKVPMGTDNATRGTQGTQGTQTAQDKAAQAKIKAGQTLKLPSQTPAGKPGAVKPYKITKVKGDEVEIQNPQAKPGEPDKVTYKKQDLEGVLSNETK